MEQTANRQLADAFGGEEGPVQAPDTEAIYLDVALEAGAEFEAALPPAHNAFAYAHSGDVQLGEERSAVERGELAVLSHGERLAARAGDAAARFILVAGKPLGEPIARYGPIVMNTQDELRRAFSDLRSGRF